VATSNSNGPKKFSSQWASDRRGGAPRRAPARAKPGSVWRSRPELIFGRVRLGHPVGRGLGVGTFGIGQLFIHGLGLGRVAGFRIGLPGEEKPLGAQFRHGRSKEHIHLLVIMDGGIVAIGAGGVDGIAVFSSTRP